MAWRQPGGSAPVRQARNRRTTGGTTPIYASWACSSLQGTPRLMSTLRSSATTRGGHGRRCRGVAACVDNFLGMDKGEGATKGTHEGRPTTEGNGRRGGACGARSTRMRARRARRRLGTGERPGHQALFSNRCTTVCPAQTQNFCTKLENLQIRKL
jgi:hypothetical protein